MSPSVRDAFLEYLKDGWHERDPRRRGISRQLRGEVVADDDVITPDEMRTSPFYNEFLPHVGASWWAGIGFRGGDDLFCLSLQRTSRQGQFTPSEKMTLQHFSARLSEIASLSHAVGQATLASVTNALDHMALAALAIDSTGRVLCHNASADRLFDGSARVSRGRLVFNDQRAAADYADLLRRLRWFPDGQALRAAPIVVRRTDAGPLVMQVLPVDGAARAPFVGARALLTLKVVERPGPPHWNLVGEAMQLTPAEARLAARLATGESVENAADALGVAKETARSQLKSIFAKTDTHRQGDLVALLHGLSSLGRL